MARRLLAALAGLVALASLPLPAAAAALTFSALSSDSTPASSLGGTIDVQVAGSTLTLTLTNTSSSFNIRALYFNGSTAVTGLTLTSATHSDAGDVTSAWALLTPDSANGNPTKAASFGTFDFLLSGPTGDVHPELVGPGESIVFVLAIQGTGPFTAADFEVLSDGKDPSFAAAKFTNGPGGDSAFGSSIVPEPATASLLAAGLAALAAARRRPRPAR